MELIKGDVLKNLSFEEALGLGVDEIADVEEFKALPRGFYIFDISDSKIEVPEQGESYIEVAVTVNGIQELKDPTEESLVTVGESKAAYRFYGSFGIQRFKTAFKCVAAHYAAQGENLSIFELIEKIKGHQVCAYNDNRKVKPKVEKGEKVDPADIKIYNELTPTSVTLAG